MSADAQISSQSVVGLVQSSSAPITLFQSVQAWHLPRGLLQGLASSPGTRPTQTLLRSHIVGQDPVPAPLKPGGDVYDSTQKINGAVSIKRKERTKPHWWCYITHTLTQRVGGGGGVLCLLLSPHRSLTWGLSAASMSDTHFQKKWDQSRWHKPAETSEEEDKCTKQSLYQKTACFEILIKA